VRAAIARHRVIWADLARQLTAAALTARHDSEYVPLNSCYVTSASTASHAERLTAYLNSTWSRAAARLGAVPAASGFARFNAQTIARLPLPLTVLTDGVLPSLAQQGRSGAEVQEELDEIVARHLSLTRTAQNALRSVLDSAARDRR
jgi:hypothetical protein